ncbi:hypothetical protein QFZ77_000004 [Paenibacillus sp. V4I3]|uniref:hypothetical protein n=1 Tax=Paenibacillus sp. V4I3 TaxID=3042305 RepID=UPI00278B5198|nr:hypothetical protein [Paenibacillus sp. V4I3]MDQ0871345.1 hypothetical protein [Paenibacillus sp. V4I3]
MNLKQKGWKVTHGATFTSIEKMIEDGHEFRVVTYLYNERLEYFDNGTETWHNCAIRKRDLRKKYDGLKYKSMQQLAAEEQASEQRQYIEQPLNNWEERLMSPVHELTVTETRKKKWWKWW